MSEWNGTVRRAVGGLAAIGLLLTPAPAPGQQQERLTGYRTTAVSPAIQMWSFSGNLYQPTLGEGDSVRLSGATQWSVPIVASVPIGARWSFDVTAAYASTNVSLDEADPELGTDSYAVSGVTDTKIRLTGRFAGENLLFTVGYNAPTGKASLDDEELAALRVAAAPALAFQMPTLGTGGGGTAGVVYAWQTADWAWAVGTSYEYRGAYTPVALAGGLPALDFNPSDAVHVSLAADGILGQHEMTFSLAADFFTEDKLSSAASGAGTIPNTKLGPIYTADWQLRLGTTGLRELTLYVTDRYRSSYSRGGVTVQQSSGNYLDAGLRAVLPLGPRTGVLTTLSARHQTGLKSDPSIATAATIGGGLTLGLAHDVGQGYLLQPFLRGQFGRIETGDNSATARELAAGITFGRRF